MIYINEDFTITNDSSGWCVVWTKDGINPKTKEPSRNSSNHYYGTLEQCCRAILDKSLKPCESVNEVLAMIEKAEQDILQAVNQHKQAA